MAAAQRILLRLLAALVVLPVGLALPASSTHASYDYDTHAVLAGTAAHAVASTAHLGDVEASAAQRATDAATRIRPAVDPSAPNSSRGLFDVRSPNPAHPPLDDVTSAMQRRYHPNCDCSEIAQDLLEASGGQGRIVRYEPQKGSVLRTPEAGGARIEDYVYHEVFTDGRYVYDPLFGSTPVPKGDYDRMIRGLNPGVRGG